MPDQARYGDVRWLEMFYKGIYSHFPYVRLIGRSDAYNCFLNAEMGVNREQNYGSLFLKEPIGSMYWKVNF